MIESIRAFGGSLSQCPVWIFESKPEEDIGNSFEGPGLKRFILDTPEYLLQNYYGDKVYACAQAKNLAPAGTGWLVWLSPKMLVIRPPELFDLSGKFDAAVRPMHIQNVGIKVTQAPDEFWRGVYLAVGVDDIKSEVESFVDGQRLRAYFNSAAFAVNPSIGLCQRWLEVFEKLVLDKTFQESACRDDWRQVFLHQAVLSALLVGQIPGERLRILSPEYVYPYNLHADVPPERKAATLNELVCIYHEGRSLDPEKMGDIIVGDSLRSWLSSVG